MEKITLGQIFFVYFDFPYQLAFHQVLIFLMSSEACTMGYLRPVYKGTVLHKRLIN